MTRRSSSRKRPPARPASPAERRAERRARLFALAGSTAALLLLALAVRLDPLPAPGTPSRAPRTRWAGGEAPSGDRWIGDPTLFAFESPVGFTRDLATERLEARPPRPPRSPSPPPAARVPARPRATPSPLPPPPPLSQLPAPASGLPAADVRPPAPDSSLVFSDGWEARLFAGLNLDYPAWLAEPWEASADLLFDARGVPVRAILSSPSGTPALDARLARDLWKLRLRDSAAPRAGTLRWRVAVPAATPPAPAVPPVPEVA